MEVRIKDFLKRVRITQYDLAEKIGCNQSLVSAWAGGTTKPTLDKIGKLIELGITADELFGPEMARKLCDNSGLMYGPPKDINTEAFRQGVEQVVIDMKNKGLL